MGSFYAKVDLLWYARYSISELNSPALADKVIGKILQDGNTVESYKIEDKGFIVCMVAKVYPTIYFLPA